VTSYLVRSVFVIALATLGGATAIQAAQTRGAAVSVTYLDATGEDAAAPDITRVVVSNDDSGKLTFRIAIPSHPVLTEDMRIRIWLDYDDDPATGLAVEGREGLDHFLLVDRGSLGFGTAGLFVCSGSTCSGGRDLGTLASLGFSYENGALFSLESETLRRTEPVRIGGLKRFRFSVEAWSGIGYDPVARTWDFTSARRDVAPAEQPSPSRDQLWTYESRPLLVRAFSVIPARPRAGMPFALRLGATRTETGAALTSGAVSCSARVAGKTLQPRSSGFVGPRAVCVFAIPMHTEGRRFRSTISVRFGRTTLTRSLSGRVR
jgi:hypothetical protein